MDRDGEQRISVCLKHHRKANVLEFSEKGSECAVIWSALRWGRGFVESNFESFELWENLIEFIYLLLDYILFLARVDNCLIF